MNLETKLTNLIQSDSLLMSILKTAASLPLNDCWVAAGVIRNKVWDTLHNIQTDINDIDVIYFDESDISVETEKVLEQKLLEMMPNQPWSVKNQARMHVKNNLLPYTSSYDGVAHFPEKPTAIAVRLNDDKLEIMAPYGVVDLYECVIKPTPPFQRSTHLHQIYLNRIQNKNWQANWNQLKIELK